MEKVEKMVIKYKGKTYELSGGGTSIPAPDSVGTNEIQNDAVMMEDLNREVKDTMITGDDRVSQEDLAGFEV